MASRKEEKERLRRAREEAERRESAEARRRLILGYVLAGLLTAAVIAGLIVVIVSSGGGDGDGEVAGAENAHINTDLGVADAEPDDREGTPPPPIEQARLEVAAKEAGCELELGLPDEGNQHFTNEQGGNYDTNPPTSGDHYGSNEPGAGALADGAYSTTPPIPRAVHSLEHGRVEIQYDPSLPDEQQLALKGVFDEDPSGMIMFPNPDLPYAVAVAAWTNYVGCREYSDGVLDVVRDFRDEFRGRGPEAVPF